MDESQAASSLSSFHLAGSQTHRFLLTINLPRIGGGWKSENTPSLASKALLLRCQCGKQSWTPRSRKP